VKATPLERDIERAICEYAKRQGCYVRKFTSPANRSVPDRIIVAPGGAVGFLEIKREGEKPTKKQAHEIKLLQAIGATATWCDGVKGGRAFVDRLICKEDFWG